MHPTTIGPRVARLTINPWNFETLRVGVDLLEQLGIEMSQNNADNAVYQLSRLAAQCALAQLLTQRAMTISDTHRHHGLDAHGRSRRIRFGIADFVRTNR